MSASPIRVAVLGDHDPHFRPHTSIRAELEHSAAHGGVGLDIQWFETDAIACSIEVLRGFDGVWAGPGSPFRSLDGMLSGIRLAREERIPFLGTCAGFQHAIIEYARNVLGYREANSAEYDPDASGLFVSRLTCSLAGQRTSIAIAPESLAYRIYGHSGAIEEYYGNFGLNPGRERDVEREGLWISARDDDGEARMIELSGHPFFVATLFVPQTSSTPDQPHPVVTAFLMAAASRRRTG
jgi:CTP synthase (UTP-ammonia lyase)